MLGCGGLNITHKYETQSLGLCHGRGKINLYPPPPKKKKSNKKSAEEKEKKFNNKRALASVDKDITYVLCGICSTLAIKEITYTCNSKVLCF